MNDADFFSQFCVYVRVSLPAYTFRARIALFTFAKCQPKRFGEMKLIICKTKN